MKRHYFCGNFTEDIARSFKLKLEGPNSYIVNSALLDTLTNNSMIAIENEEQLNKIDFDRYKDLLVITNCGNTLPKHISVIRVDNPLYYFLIITERFFTRDIELRWSLKASVEEPTGIPVKVYIGPGCYIESGVSIGNKSLILPNCVISGQTWIGKNCIVEPCTVIGNNYYRHVTQNDKVVTFPYLGPIFIGDDVIIGANSVIESGTDKITSIGREVIIKNSVTIGSNCRIDDGSVIPAGTVLPPYTHYSKNGIIPPVQISENNIENNKTPVSGQRGKTAL